LADGTARTKYLMASSSWTDPGFIFAAVAIVTMPALLTMLSIVLATAGLLPVIIARVLVAELRSKAWRAAMEASLLAMSKKVGFQATFAA